MSTKFKVIQASLVASPRPTFEQKHIKKYNEVLVIKNQYTKHIKNLKWFKLTAKVKINNSMVG